MGFNSEMLSKNNHVVLSVKSKMSLSFKTIGSLVASSSSVQILISSMISHSYALLLFLLFLFPLVPMIQANVNDIDPITINSILVNDQYKVLKKIGGGTYGSVYDGVDTYNGEAVAIKMEMLETMYPMLIFEYEKYRILNNSDFFPRVYWMGVYGNHHALVLQKLGAGVDQNKRPVEIRIISLIGENILSAVEELHNKALIHRDIKPSNILLGTSSKFPPRYYLIDLGSSTAFCSGLPTHGECSNPYNTISNNFTIPLKHHLLYEEEIDLVGTIRYASFNAYLGRELSRRDDLESLVYTLMSLHRNLPWQGSINQNLNSQQMMEVSKQLRVNISLTRICFGMPEELCLFLKYARSLGFYETPNYEYLRHLLGQLRKHSSSSSSLLNHSERNLRH